MSFFDFGNSLGLAIGKCSMKIIFDIKIEISIFEISNVPNLINPVLFNYGTNLGLTGGKYFIKIIFDIKIEVVHIRNNEYAKFQLTLKYTLKLTHIRNKEYAKFQLTLSSFNFGTNLGPIGGKYFIKIIFDIKIEIGVLET